MSNSWLLGRTCCSPAIYQLTCPVFTCGQVQVQVQVQKCSFHRNVTSAKYRPEIEGFRDQGFVLPEGESLRVQSFVAS